MNATNLTKNEQAASKESTTLVPPVDVYEDATGITLYADLPGVPKDKLSVRVEADTLSIDGEVTLSTPVEMEANHAEIQCQTYRRSFTLGQELDRDKLAAEFRHGVLKLHIPKVEKAKPRKIEVKVV